MKERTVSIQKTIEKEKIFEDKLIFETYKQRDIKYERVRKNDKEVFFVGENDNYEESLTKVDIIDTSVEGNFINIPLNDHDYNLIINLKNFKLPDTLKIDQIKISEEVIDTYYELEKDKKKQITVKSLIKSYSVSLSLVYDGQTIDEYINIDEKSLPYINYEINELLINLVKKSGMKQIKEGIYKCFFNSQCTESMINIFSGLINGQDIIDKSIYYESIGQQIMHNSINIIEKPFGIIDFDGNIKKSKFLVQNGILQTFLLNRKSAAKLSLKPTGNAGMMQEICSYVHMCGNKIYEEYDLEIIELLGIDYNENTGHFNAVITGFLHDKPVNGGIISFNLKDFFKEMRLCNDGLFMICNIAV